jgi:phosphatidate phosphatase LPIN
MGHIMTVLGKDYSHDGVAKLYTELYKRNFTILYLTSRPIGQVELNN